MHLRQSRKLTKRAVDGLWILFVKLQYPKLASLVLAAILAYWSFQNKSVQSFFHSLGDLGYLTAFIGGALFAFGFGAPFGVALLATIANDVNIFIAAAIGGGGALASDYVLFKFIRTTFADEIQRLKGSRPYHVLDGVLKNTAPPKVRFYFGAALAGLIIASPLPDEIGVTILAGLTRVSERNFAILSFTLNTLGILAILGAGTII